MEIELSGLNPFDYLLSANYRIYWVFLVANILIAIVFLYFNPRYKKINYSKKLWLHPSAVFDYSYFFVIFFIKILIIAPLVFSATAVAMLVNNFLLDNFGYFFSTVSYTFVIIFFTLSVFLASDLSRYALHFAMHKFDFLWRFHKFHHSAKVLTPLTFYRIHPIESLLFGLRYSLVIGLVGGIFLYFFGNKIGMYEIMGVSVLQFIPNLFANLRHSHIPLSFGVFEHIFISPKQHQIHHDKRYVNTNFGGVLSIWDKIFNTIKYSSANDTKKLMIGLRKSV